MQIESAAQLGWRCNRAHHIWARKKRATQGNLANNNSRDPGPTSKHAKVAQPGLRRPLRPGAEPLRAVDLRRLATNASGAGDDATNKAAKVVGVQSEVNLAEVFALNWCQLRAQGTRGVVWWSKQGGRFVSWQSRGAKFKERAELCPSPCRRRPPVSILHPHRSQSSILRPLNLTVSIYHHHRRNPTPSKDTLLTSIHPVELPVSASLKLDRTWITRSDDGVRCGCDAANSRGSFQAGPNPTAIRSEPRRR